MEFLTTNIWIFFWVKHSIYNLTTCDIFKTSELSNVLFIMFTIKLFSISAGILFSNSPTPLEQYNASVSSARAFGGISSGSSQDHDHHDHSDHNHEHDHDHHEHEQSSSSPPRIVPETQSDEGLNPSIISDESSDMSMYGE